MTRLASRLLRIALLVLLLASVLAQAIVPAYATEVATRFPEVAHLVGPYAIAAILCIACGQVALLGTWRLLSLVDAGIIFTRRSMPWVDLILACGAIATSLTGVVLLHALAFVPGGGGPMAWYLGGCIVAGLAFVLLMVVLRGLLLAVVADRTGLEAAA